MSKKLLSSQIIFILLVALTTFVIITTFTSYEINKLLLESESHSLYKEAMLISNDYATSYYNDDITLEDFKSKLHSIDTYLNAKIWILDSDGTLLISSGKEAENFSKITDFSISYFGDQYSTVGTFYDCFTDRQLTVYSPISLNYKVRGYVFIHKSVSKITTELNDLMQAAYYTFGLVFTAFVLLLMIHWSHTLSPVKKMAKVASEYANGSFENKLDETGPGEIGVLGASIKYMAHELQSLEDDQKKFVSNVSHDFRSPLTSIKGYVEAMQDGTIPVEMQDKYLNIILYEAERLNKLTESLLELNKYGRSGTYLDISTFDINSLIKQTLLTFEGRCVEKRIKFELILTGDVTNVMADKGKIQQVVHNLVDNAIKFSPVSSTITVETNITNGKVFISVKDRGVGIPSDSQTKIWERFYKTDPSRGKDKKGTGLGLAIVKEIISAHKENINVISTEGVGSEFIFSLPLSENKDEDHN
ncbi:MAG: HAMP domain-containing histidine kinase [Lachnospiraceae bacterium]|nr:HAMP domain-containing histidine kinase [Lachnospiraceae bacterium]